MHVKLITYVNNDNGFDLIIAVVFTMIPQKRVLGSKAQYIVIYFCLAEGETLPQFHLRALQIRSTNFLLQDKTGQINNLTGIYIMEQSKLKHFQRYMIPYKLDYMLVNV